MKRAVKISLAVLLALSMVLSTYYVSPKAEAYTPTYTTLKIGLVLRLVGTCRRLICKTLRGMAAAMSSAYWDDDRNFVSLGASTSEVKITMLRDRNMVYDSSDNSYEPGSTGSVVVGCYHIQLNSSYSSYSAALAAVSGYDSGFVKYSNGNYYGMIGNYTSSTEASAAISSYGLTGCAVNCGSSYTMTVVATGTNDYSVRI